MRQSGSQQETTSAHGESQQSGSQQENTTVLTTNLTAVDGPNVEEETISPRWPNRCNISNNEMCMNCYRRSNHAALHEKYQLMFHSVSYHELKRKKFKVVSDYREEYCVVCDQCKQYLVDGDDSTVIVWPSFLAYFLLKGKEEFSEVTEKHSILFMEEQHYGKLFHV